MSDGRVVRSGAGDAAARSTAEAGPDGKVHFTHTQSYCHMEIDSFSILNYHQGNRLGHNTRVLSIK